jgi:hypothetical protein
VANAIDELVAVIEDSRVADIASSVAKKVGQGRKYHRRAGSPD